ncbi:tRNA-specific adenosine deaminase 1 [Caerostris darwini]|uniref:tRNA-specific adenosine deaminase 1 n=1 Tax=Caerostris darwini TaxID=1538125 RepID=A0AAV4SZH0_9ARAC|nr:tRNA-specific adenosine deaminase 1 [Caerostris darwini]
MFSPEFPDEVAKLCYDNFTKLPSKGKPQKNKEWTLLAAILMSTEYPKQSLKIVSLTTGTKCLGYSQLSDKGDIIFDSHAEILARRGLIKFLMYQMHEVLHKNDSEVLCYNEKEKKFNLKCGISFHLFVSHIPCGDAAIFLKNSETTMPPCLEEQIQSDSGESLPKKIKLDVTEVNDLNSIEVNSSSSCASIDIYRTGAKCVQGELQDPKGPGQNFHVTGVLRTKPGRGDPTWSMSCSDKIALWNICGIQGALLSCLLTKPIYLSSLIFGKCPFDTKAVQRAVIERLSDVTSLPSGYYLNKPTIHQSSLVFDYSKEILMKENSSIVPCPASIIWLNNPKLLEVSVNGKKQGVTKKNFNKPFSRISICKSILFEDFLEICTLLSEKSTGILIDAKDNLAYLEYKQMAKSYQDAKLAFWKVFDKWKRKPSHLQKFTLSCTKKVIN